MELVNDWDGMKKILSKKLAVPEWTFDRLPREDADMLLKSMVVTIHIRQKLMKIAREVERV